MSWWFKSLRSTKIVMLNTILTGSCKIQCRLPPLGSHSLQEWRCQPSAAAVVASTRCASALLEFPNGLWSGCVNIPVKQTGDCSGWKGLPTGINAGRCFQCSLENSDSVTEKKRRHNEQQNADLSTSAGDRVGLQSYLPSIWYGWGAVKSILLVDMKKKCQSTHQPVFISLKYVSLLADETSKSEESMQQNKTFKYCLDFLPGYWKSFTYKLSF